jgi:hypothetical protein
MSRFSPLVALVAGVPLLALEIDPRADVHPTAVLMGNNTAEFGSLGQVTVISKSGTNDLHGAGFDYYTTPKFLARNPFSLTSSSNVQHQPGFVIGGPMYFPKI